MIGNQDTSAQDRWKSAIDQFLRHEGLEVFPSVAEGLNETNVNVQLSAVMQKIADEPSYLAGLNLDEWHLELMKVTGVTKKQAHRLVGYARGCLVVPQ